MIYVVAPISVHIVFSDIAAAAYLEIMFANTDEILVVIKKINFDIIKHFLY